MAKATARRQFIARLGAPLARISLRPVPIPIDGFKYPLFFRLIDELVLILVVEFSVHRPGWVTGSRCISASFRWGYVPSGVGYSNTVYTRITDFFAPEDHALVISRRDDGYGGWWYGTGEATSTAFAEAVVRTEPRFLAQAPLAAYRRSAYYKGRREILALVRARLPGPAPALQSLADEDALEPWIRAAEQFVATDRRIHRSKVVIRALAADAAVSTAVGLIA